MNEESFTNLGPRWYVVHTYAGYENKVKTNLEKIIDNRNLHDMIMEVQIPMEITVEGAGEDAKEVESKVFPSYVLVKMCMTDATWHVVRNITGVTGFVGPGSRPVPLSDEEVAAIGVETKVIALGFDVGDSVKIVSGALAGFNGVVQSISDDKKKINVLASMFGRETPVELSAEDVTKIED